MCQQLDPLGSRVALLWEFGENLHPVSCDDDRVLELSRPASEHKSDFKEGVQHLRPEWGGGG